MMDMRKLLLAFALVLFALPAFSYTFTDLTWNGLVTVSLDNDKVTEGSPITGTVVIDNLEQYPIVGERLVFQVGSGEYKYPSQFASDNIVSETSIIDIWVLPSSNKIIPFSIPSLKAGKYHLDTYSWVLKSKLIGASSVMYNPQTIDFEVTGQTTKPNAEIDRAQTVFGDESKWYSGPVGFPVKSEEKFFGKVFIKNPSTETKSSMKLEISMCDWAVVFCDPTTLEKKTFDVPSIAAGATAEVAVELTAPSIPSAYEINMQLKNASSTESIYKNRVIVSGGTSKARKIYVDGLADRNYLLNVFIAGSPDHFTNPDFNDFTLSVEIYDEAQKLEEKSVNIAGIGMDDVLMQPFDVTDKMFTKACVKVKKDGKTFESECFTVPLKELQEAYDAAHPELVKAEWRYDESGKALTITLTKKTKPVNAKVRIFTSSKTIILENVSQASPYTKTFTVEKDDLTMTVDDFDAKRQQVFNLTLNLGDKTQLASEVDPNATEATENGDCTMNVCANGQVCQGKSYTSPQGLCCSGACSEGVSSTGILGEEVPFIFWMALIMIVLAATIGAGTLTKAKKKGALK